MNSSLICPCCSGKSYVDCCGLYLDKGQYAPNPEALMRSRYTAYAQANIAYIMATMTGKAAKDYDPISAKTWAENAVWLGLEIISAPKVKSIDKVGFVEFRAKFSDEAIHREIHEKSHFEKIDGKWFYVNGDVRY